MIPKIFPIQATGRVQKIPTEYWEKAAVVSSLIFFLMGVFQEIFCRYREDRYDEVVQKMLGCGDVKSGYATYIVAGIAGRKPT
jgi:hypothetical protein